MRPLQREILVIDGDERARALMGQILAEQGFAVMAVGMEVPPCAGSKQNPLRWSSPRSGCRDRSIA
jgi:hypothetical protein